MEAKCLICGYLVEHPCMLVLEVRVRGSLRAQNRTFGLHHDCAARAAAEQVERTSVFWNGADVTWRVEDNLLM